MISRNIAIVFVVFGLFWYKCCADDSVAIQYNSDTFEEAKGTGPLFVKFYAPWCGHCKRLAPTWEELAAKYNNDAQVVIGKVDCTVETALCSDHGVTGYPTLKFFAADGTDKKYRGGRDIDSLSQFVNKEIAGPDDDEDVPAADSATAQAKEGLYTLTASNFYGHIAKGNHFIKFYAPWCGHCKRLAPTWEELGQKYKNNKDVKIGKVDCTEHGEACQKFEVRGYPTLLFIKDGQLSEKYSGARDISAFETFITKKTGKEVPKKEEKAVPAEEPTEGLIILTKDNIKETLDSEATTFVKFYAPWCGHCKAMAGEWVKMAAKYANMKGVQIAKMDCTQHREACSEYKVQGFPSLKIFRKGEEITAHRGGRDVATLSKVLMDNVLEGQIDPEAVVKEPPKEEEPLGDKEAEKDEDTNLYELTDETFDSVFRSTKTLFVKFFAPWCGHCQRLAPDWIELAKSFKGDEDVVIAKIDCTEDRAVCTRQGVRGYPTLKAFRDGKELGEHNGARSVEAMREFVNGLRNKQEEADDKKDEL